MTLSVVIVNYNVKYFLEQCLESVFASETGGTELEVFVVDNNSVDNSVQMVQNRFPQVQLIANTDNVGFAKANNQALRQCSGDYLLLLNPDTLVERDTFARCIDFMQQHPTCGGLGVKMIDGKGNYLRESKRGFPSPETSFYKLTGLTRIFPHSKRFAAYYMGHLSEDETNEIEILPGAFMMFSRSAFNAVGLLDESYFMYGEDIDYSWRIKLAGYKNYYLPSARIIHYKGESTKKGSMNYVYTFYNAMAIFARHYFSGSNARIFNMLLQTAIWLRAGLSFLQRIARQVAVPLADFALSYAGFVVIKNLWATYWAANINYYPPQYTTIVIPLYILTLMAASWLSGGYDKPIKLSRTIRGMAIGLALLLAFYSLLDETQRYSRMLLILGSIWTLASHVIIRMVLSAIGADGYTLTARKRKMCLVVGNPSECKRVADMYASLNLAPTTDVNPNETSRLSELIRYYNAGEVIFCAKDLPPQQIITLMASLKTTGLEYKIAPSEGDYIIGSNGIASDEDILSVELDTVASPTNRRKKRLFDITTSFALLLLSPILIWSQEDKGRYLRHCISVLFGTLSWVGYSGRDGVFMPANIVRGASTQLAEHLNYKYMRKYRVSTDWKILTRNIGRL
ncbi:MAG: glycosyltransferase family 2 protein [Bacteroidales bacterium]|nr:glycosyltransferase family 2 protein [Bacteroidales bacterium]